MIQNSNNIISLLSFISQLFENFKRRIPKRHVQEIWLCCTQIRCCGDMTKSTARLDDRTAVYFCILQIGSTKYERFRCSMHKLRKLPYA